MIINTVYFLFLHHYKKSINIKKIESCGGGGGGQAVATLYFCQGEGGWALITDDYGGGWVKKFKKSINKMITTGREGSNPKTQENKRGHNLLVLSHPFSQTVT